MTDRDMAREAAKKRVQELKGYYRHIAYWLL